MHPAPYPPATAGTSPIVEPAAAAELYPIIVEDGAVWTAVACGACGTPLAHLADHDDADRYAGELVARHRRACCPANLHSPTPPPGGPEGVV